jgi:hypothetical protein
MQGASVTHLPRIFYDDFSFSRHVMCGRPHGRGGLSGRQRACGSSWSTCYGSLIMI